MSNIYKIIRKSLAPMRKRLLATTAIAQVRPFLGRAKTAIYNSTPASILAMIVAACGGGGGAILPQPRQLCRLN